MVALGLSLAAACGGGGKNGSSTITVEAIAAATHSDDYTMTMWLASGSGRPKDLPPLSITSLSGDRARTENNGLAWIRASALAEGASNDDVAELDALIASGPNVIIETPEGVYFTRPDLLEIGAGRDPSLSPNQVGFVSHAQLENNDGEVAQAIQRLTTALGGSAATDPLQFLTEFGARIQELDPSSADGFRTLEACAKSLDLMTWFVRTVGGSDKEVDEFVKEAGDRVRGEICWTLAIDDQGRIRRSHAEIDFKKMLRGQLPPDLPEVMIEEIEWAYDPVVIEVPTAEPVDVSEVYFDLLES